MKVISIDGNTPLFHLTVNQFLDLQRQTQERPAPENIIPEIYGVETLQQITGYSKAAIYGKTSRGEMPHFKRDGRLYFRHSDIILWMTENRIETKTEFSRKMDQKLSERVK